MKRLSDILGRFKSEPAAMPWHLVAAFILLALGIISAGYFYSIDQKSRIVQNTYQNLTLIADLKVDQIKNWREERLYDAGAILGNPFIPALVDRWFKSKETDPKIRDELLGWMDSVRNRKDYDGISLIDPEGNVRLAQSQTNIPLDAHEKSLAMEALKQRKIVLSDLYQEQEDGGEICIAAMVPLILQESKDSRPIGVMFLKIHAEHYLFSLIQTWPTASKTAETLLVRREGNDVLFLNDLRHRKDTALKLRMPADSSQMPAAMAARGLEGTVLGTDYRGVPVFAEITKIPDTGWSLIAKIDRSEVFQPILEREFTAAVLVVVMIAAIAMGVIAIWRKRNAAFYQKQYETEMERLALLKHFEYLTRHANDIIILADSERRIVEANERATQAYGYSRDELLGMRVEDLRAPQEQSTLNTQWKEISDPAGKLYETVHRRSDGTTFPVEISARIVDVEEERFYQAIIRDITERKKAELELKQSEDRYRRLVERSPDMIAVHSGLKIVYINPAGAKLIGAERPEEIVGQHLLDFIPPEYHEIVRQRAQKVEVEGQYTPLLELKMKRFDGALVDVESTGMPFFYEGRYATQVIVRDITERKRMGEELSRAYNDLEFKVEQRTQELMDVNEQLREEMIEHREADDRLRSANAYNRSLLEASLDPLVTIGPDGTVTDVNAATENATGLTRKELIGTDFSNYFTDPQRAQAGYQQVFREGIVRDYELEIRHKDGWITPVLYNAAVYRDEPGNVIGVFAAARDITERRRAEAELLRTQEELADSKRLSDIGALAATVAHELRNPLAVMQTALYNIRRKVQDHTLDKHLLNVEHKIAESSQIINNLLFYSRIKRPNYEKVVLSGLVDECMTTARERFHTMNVRVEKGFDSIENILVDADSFQMKEVFNNILINAYQAVAEDGGSIRIDGRLDEDRCVEVKISDNGAGIEPEDIDKVFEPFFTRKSKGTGLGLAVCRELVRLHNGEVRINSERGRGTSVTIRLPIEA